MLANSGHVSGIRYNCLIGLHPNQLNGAWNDVIIMLHICNIKLFNFIGVKLPREQIRLTQQFRVSDFRTGYFYCSCKIDIRSHRNMLATKWRPFLEGPHKLKRLCAIQIAVSWEHRGVLTVIRETDKYMAGQSLLETIYRLH